MLWNSFARSLVIGFALGAVNSFAQGDARISRAHTMPGMAKDAAALWPMDILHQRIDLDLSTGNIITGRCSITALPRADGTDHFPLQLLALTVDSVTTSSGTLTFAQVAEDLDITLAAPLNTTDTVALTVHYHGDPVTDGSGFGGFYTTGQYSYNLGVAFQSLPHSYGRAWFPCADNFTERNSYEYIITTPIAWNAWCNGVLLSESQPTPTTRQRHWKLDEEIPAYLASVAASNYAVVRDTLPSVAGMQIPVTLVARPTDTTNMKSSFTHLDDAFSTFEDWFGAYRWNRVGYVLTPQGAMEHPTSIHYPQGIADGTLSYQNIMAHELGHHWFGDLVTCDKPEAMYINEGFAEYLSYLFVENVSGRESYMNMVRANHKKMVHQAHQLDEGWWALDSVPQAWTYGEHSYNKGADVIHTLRSYLGDSLFRAGFTSFLNAYPFQSVNSVLMRDHLSQSTGIDLTDFFHDWILQPGWSAFEVDDLQATLNGSAWNVHVELSQKLRGPASLYHHVPVTLVLMGADHHQQHRVRVDLGGQNTSIDVSCPFQPMYQWLNDDDRISLAITGSTDTITTGGGLHSFALANFDLVLPAITDTLVTRVEQYWVAPDNAPVEEAFAFIISPDRYWRVAGDVPAGCTGRVIYDGRNVTTGNLDPLLLGDTLGFSFIEDSLVMLYRAEPTDPWSTCRSAVNTLGSHSDGYGRMTIDSLRTGEYTLAWRKSAVDIAERTVNSGWRIAPNPSSGEVTITASTAIGSGTIQVIDSAGRVVRSVPMKSNRIQLDLHRLTAGTYQLQFQVDPAHVERIGPLVIE